jgi:nucleotide-binding universal stress UspA family protein
MTYATLLVNLIAGSPNRSVLNAAHELAKLFGSRAIGIVACEPVPIMTGDGIVDGQMFVDFRTDLDRQILETQSEFRKALETDKIACEWRTNALESPPIVYVANEARCADLLIAAAVPRELFASTEHAGLGDLIMHAGRPVLMVPHAGARFPFNRVVVAWRDTREARRAIRDALPLLKAAHDVSVVEIASKEATPLAHDHIKDVTTWLERHGVKAAPLVVPATGDDAHDLEAFLEKQGADLVVAGAYGHSRLREWAFGGVTDGILRNGRCALLSH